MTGTSDDYIRLGSSHSGKHAISKNSVFLAGVIVVIRRDCA
ncbi:hypothetical protein APHMUC_0262 [Anaplasma phagocytophilum str. ApMUC09]|uniref:Uncharacterized protein n=1 Tax=Anaplasma phagocytophilum str. ApMUC09 TaxID=1359152 RepID=A0A0F3NCX0_ANAPH|nr:hypothetical protein APHMUC_0262 [Anaplasma phagocytophilum str. ApMUC09]